MFLIITANIKLLDQMCCTLHRIHHNPLIGYFQNILLFITFIQTNPIFNNVSYDHF